MNYFKTILMIFITIFLNTSCSKTNFIDDNASIEELNTLLISSCTQGKDNLSIVKECIKQGADINYQDNDGNTALIKCCSLAFTDSYDDHRDDIVKFLLKKGADVNITNNDGNTSLLEITRYSPFDTTLIIVTNLFRFSNDELDVNIQNKNGETALMKACSTSNLPLVRLLVYYSIVYSDTSINYNLQDNEGMTALMHLAFGAGQPYETADYLLDKGIDITIQDNNGNTAIDYAKWLGRNELIELIESY